MKYHIQRPRNKGDYGIILDLKVNKFDWSSKWAWRVRIEPHVGVGREGELWGKGVSGKMFSTCSFTGRGKQELKKVD